MLFSLFYYFKVVLFLFFDFSSALFVCLFICLFVLYNSNCSSFLSTSSFILYLFFPNSSLYTIFLLVFFLFFPLLFSRSSFFFLLHIFFLFPIDFEPLFLFLSLSAPFNRSFPLSHQPSNWFFNIRCHKNCCIDN